MRRPPCQRENGAKAAWTHREHTTTTQTTTAYPATSSLQHPVHSSFIPASASFTQTPCASLLVLLSLCPSPLVTLSLSLTHLFIHPSIMPVDSTATVHGFALKDPKGQFEPWTYHPRPLGDDDCELKIEYCGICASDIHCAFGGWGHVDYPIIVGHEIVGTVAAVGKNVKNVKVGDRVGCGAQCGSCMQRNGEKCRGCPTHEQHCNQGTGMIGTYNGTYPDGEKTMGGYADMKRFDAHFAFKIPEKIASAEAAPLLCAGVTVYAPLARYKAGKGKKVAVVGLGGLGHLAVQFAAKMGAEVIAVGNSPDKAELAKKLGATEYITPKDDAAWKQHAGTVDIVIHTANGKGMDWQRYLGLGALDSHYVLVGAPEDALNFQPFALIGSRVNLVGSLIGSSVEIADMLEFAAKNDVRPMIELLPMSQVNEGIRKVKENDVKFRVVLEQGK